MDIELRIVVPVLECTGPHDQKALDKLASTLEQVQMYLAAGVPEQWVTGDNGIVTARYRVEVNQE